MTKQILRLCALFTASALLPAALHAQTANSNFAQESELNACLVLEKEGLQRFNALETRATELRGVDSLLRNRREALVKSRQHMDAKRPGSQEVARFNADVATFNQQTDQLNADKAAYEADKASYETWLNTTLKPTCKKLDGKPVPPITAYYACGHDRADSALLQVPYCKNLANVAALKTCATKAGSKTAAYSACMNF